MAKIRGKESKKLLDALLADSKLAEAIGTLPKNYNFEIPKTIWRIRTTGCKQVALQFPEGLLLYACRIADIIEEYTEGVHTLIMGDITYGACCVDDLTAKELGCDMLVHYGHSCLVPITETPGITMLYIFVDIDINVSKLLELIRETFPVGSKLALVSTVQFVRALQTIHTSLTDYTTLVPQCKPLSPGEVLGCTSPKLPLDCTALIYVGDGRFHLESAMIQNPKIPAYQYDPYNGAFTREFFDFEKMLADRQKSIEAMKSAKVVGVVLGTLGRQGSVKVYDIQDKKEYQPYGFQDERHLEQRKGHCAGKLPVKMNLKKGKVYAWCSCGFSGRQPLCDGSHNRRLRPAYLGLKPVRYAPEQDESKWMCVCKQTADKPWCDGSHKTCKKPNEFDEDDLHKLSQLTPLGNPASPKLAPFTSGDFMQRKWRGQARHFANAYAKPESEKGRL